MEKALVVNVLGMDASGEIVNIAYSESEHGPGPKLPFDRENRGLPFL